MIKKQIASISLLILSGLLLLSLAFISKTVYDIKTLSNSIHTQRTELEKKYETGQSLKDLVRNLRQMEPRLTALEQSLLPSNDTLTFINDLENTAENHHLDQIIRLADFEFNNELILSTPIQLTVNGSYDNLIYYLQDLDTKPYYFNINKLDISSESENRSIQTITATIEANIYWKNNE